MTVRSLVAYAADPYMATLLVVFFLYGGTLLYCCNIGADEVELRNASPATRVAEASSPSTLRRRDVGRPASSNTTSTLLLQQLRPVSVAVVHLSDIDVVVSGGAAAHDWHSATVKRWRHEIISGDFIIALYPARMPSSSSPTSYWTADEVRGLLQQSYPSSVITVVADDTASRRRSLICCSAYQKPPTDYAAALFGPNGDGGVELLRIHLLPTAGQLKQLKSSAAFFMSHSPNTALRRIAGSAKDGLLVLLPSLERRETKQLDEAVQSGRLDGSGELPLPRIEEVLWAMTAEDSFSIEDLESETRDALFWYAERLLRWSVAELPNGAVAPQHRWVGFLSRCTSQTVYSWRSRLAGDDESSLPVLWICSNATEKLEMLPTLQQVMRIPS